MKITLDINKQLLLEDIHPGFSNVRNLIINRKNQDINTIGETAPEVAAHQGKVNTDLGLYNKDIIDKQYSYNQYKFNDTRESLDLKRDALNAEILQQSPINHREAARMGEAFTDAGLYSNQDNMNDLIP